MNADLVEREDKDHEGDAELYRMVVEQAADGIFLSDPDGNYVSVNDSGCQMLGYTRAEILKRNSREIIAPQDLSVQPIQLDSLRAGKTVISERQLVRKDGTLVSVEINAKMLSNRHLLDIVRDITERKRTAEIIQLKDELLRQTGDLAHIGGWDFDAATLQGTWTDEVARIHDLDPGQPTNVALGVSFYTGESKEKINLAIQDALTRAKPYDLELEILTAAGNHKWVRTIGTPILEDGKVTRVSGIIQDISEQKHKEVEIRTLAKFPGENPNPILRIGSDGILMYANKASALLRLTWNCSVGEAIPEPWSSLAVQALRTGQQNEIQVDCGQQIYSLQFTPIADENYVNIYAHDITERLRAEAQLAEHHATLTAILESADWPVFSLDTGYGYTSFNRAHAAAMQVFYGASIQIGHCMAEYMAETDWQAAKANLDRGLAGETIIQSTFSGAEDRLRRYFEVAHNPITAEGGKIIGVSVFARDITERKRVEDQIHLLNAELEQRVRERTEQLERANKELEAFTYSVSHDLRAPLRGIDGWSHILLDDCYEQLTPQGRESLAFIRSETKRMGLLIENLLHFSRINRSEMLPERVDLSAMAQVIVDRLHRDQPLPGAEVILQPGLTVYGDSGLLEIMLTNLLSNAWKFSAGSPTARIELGRIHLDGKRVIFVRDNGVGFDMAYAEKLFGVFQRLHRASEYPGTGIGLAIVQRIVHRHGGDVWAQSEVNRGATFFFTLEEIR